MAPPPMTQQPQPHPSHGLLAGKTVVVTAAAGTGIGFATARRCAEEGARVAISDVHERRLGVAADELALIAGEQPLAIACDVTVEDDVRRLFDTVAAEYGRIDVAVNNAGLGGDTPLAEMTDEQWYRVLDVTLNGTFRCTRAALRHMLPARQRCDRQQRLGDRLARPGGPGALRRGEGGRHGAHPVRGDRGGTPRRAGERGGAEHRDAPAPGEDLQRGTARRARRARGVRPGGRSRGRSPTSSSSSPAATPRT